MTQQEIIDRIELLQSKLEENETSVLRPIIENEIKRLEKLKT